MSAKSRLEDLGSKVTKTEDGKFLVTDPRWPDTPQGPWTQEQVDGWANAVESSPQPLEVVTEPVSPAPAKVAKPPAKAAPKKA
jgi:hypothetical protein